MTRILQILFYLFISTNILAQSIEHQEDSILVLIQNEVSDSIKARHYLDLGLLTLYTQPLKSIQYSYQTLDISQQEKLHRITSNAYIQLFNTQLFYGSPSDTLIQTIQSLESHIKENGKEENMWSVHWIYALYYHNIQQLDKTIEAYINALEIVQKYFDSPNMEAGLLCNIGIILAEQDKPNEALDYYNKALKLEQDDIGLGGTYQNLGDAYNQLEQFDTAFTYFELAYKYNKKAGDTKGIAVALIEKGNYYSRKEQFERADQLYFETLKIIRDNNIGSLLPLIYTSLAQQYQQQNNYNLAVSYGQKALVEINRQQNYDELIDVYELLQKSYASQGNYKEAFRIRGALMSHKDSVSNAELRTKVEALKTEYEVEQKETENQLLKANNIAKQKTIDSRNITALALGIGLLLLGGLVFVIYRSNLQKQRYNEQLEATVVERTAELQKVNKDLEQANYELKMFNYIASHDIKEPIRNVGNYAGLIFRKLPVNLQFSFKDYFDTIKKSTIQLYTLVEDFSKYTQLSKGTNLATQSVDLNAVLTNLELNLATLLQEKSGRIINKGLPTIKTNSSLVYTILKNLIENGLKFNQSPVPTITLSANETETFTEIFIKDNGIGIEPAYQRQIFEMFKRLHHRHEYKGSGIGLSIVKLLLDKIGGTIEIKSEKDKGSTFKLKIPK